MSSITSEEDFFSFSLILAVPFAFSFFSSFAEGLGDAEGEAETVWEGEAVTVAAGPAVTAGAGVAAGVGVAAGTTVEKCRITSFPRTAPLFAVSFPLIVRA